MPNIRANLGVVTQINVFECLPENQAALVELLQDAARAVRDIDGWMSASIHRNEEGTRVVNYAQCRDMESWNRVMSGFGPMAGSSGTRRLGRRIRGCMRSWR